MLYRPKLRRAEPIQRGTIRNVARLEVSNLEQLSQVLFRPELEGTRFGNTVMLSIQINDRSSVTVPLVFEVGQDEVIIGRARPIDPTTFADDSTLQGRISANFDEAENTLTLRYIERANLSTLPVPTDNSDDNGVSEARRFSARIDISFNAPGIGFGMTLLVIRHD